MAAHLPTSKAQPVSPATRNEVLIPKKPLQVHYWHTFGSDEAGDIPSRDFAYPEVSSGKFGIKHIAEKPNLGVAVSGGGFRAATLASGWVRGLNQVSCGKARDR